MNPAVYNGNKLRWKFDSMSTLSTGGTYSTDFVIGPTTWRIFIKRMNSDFGLSLHLASNSSNDKSWLIEADADLKVLKQTDEGDVLTRSYKHCFLGNQQWGWSKFETWQTISSAKYMENNSITIDIDVDIKVYDFSQKIPNFTDLTIIVAETEFPINKGVLCSKSKFFYNLFITENFEQNIYKIDDISLNDFRMFIAFFYPVFDCVETSNYSKMIELARKYEVGDIHQKCENFLISNESTNLLNKFKYADKNDYGKLMKHCVSQLKTGEEIKKIRKTVEFENFKDTTKLRILNRFLDFY
ncbi:unnamed protein product [Caenorhabditis angaria]|uniref:BTB domain-containing protein n=1 Tax=Caenorhabditis angaria TaxID=860376 RepID=A0A9P1MU23_9PELO|nr:unnamed protein product [Caenorhabditis angaria]